MTMKRKDLSRKTAEQVGGRRNIYTVEVELIPVDG